MKYLGFWLDSFTPLMHDSKRLHVHKPLIAEVTQMIYVVFFNEKASRRCDNTGTLGTGTYETLLTCIS